MKNKTPNNSKNKDVRKIRHPYEYFDFIVWIAQPKELRVPKTQRLLAKKFGVGEDTLSEWKTRDNFWESVSEQRQKWCREKTSDVINSLYKRILLSGSAGEVRLWMEIVEDWFSKNVMIEHPLQKYMDMSETEIDAEIKKGEDFFKKKGDNKVNL